MYKYFPKITFGKYFDTKQKEGGLVSGNKQTVRG